MASRSIKDMFAKVPKKAPEIGAGDMPDLQVLDTIKDHATGGADKRMSVERIYQKKTQLEHILLRPDSYIGSVETLTQPMWVYDDTDKDNGHMVQRDITFVPGLYKIFDEILVNAADNKQRDPKMKKIEIKIEPQNNMIEIYNDGKGIPVVEHKVEKIFVPTLIFGHLLTSSNYNDDEKKVTGGRNGYGAKLCNIFSKKFIVETADGKNKFKQVWTDNMGSTTDAKITPSNDNFTRVTFYPDLEKFHMEKLDKDTVDLFVRRAYDIAASSRGGVEVRLNGKRLPVKTFKDYIDLYIKDKVDDNNQPYKVVYEKKENERWEVAVTLSDKGFQQVSFVNSIATTKGGRHVDYVADQLVSKIIEVVKKKQKKDNIAIKPFQVKNHMWVFINCLIENPSFDSQTKENMTLQVKSFGSKFAASEKFAQEVQKCGIVESVLSWMTYKAQEKLNKACGSSKRSKLTGIPKLDDANDAGTKNSMECTLILTEGDSAKTLAVAGLGVVGRDRYGVFPLKGKVLNVREATHKQIMENAEINNIIKILGLRYKEKYDSTESMKTLRYGKVMIMTDQDQDGSHIKGLLVNFIHHNWPSLLKQSFVEEFITPIVKATKNKQEMSFFSLPEFEEWKKNTENWRTYKVKYYKGLGTSTSKEAKEYFSDMGRHRIKFKYSGVDDDNAVNLAFSKKKIEERKEWLTNWMEERKRRSELGLPEVYLYGKDTKSVTYNEFVNKELILFSNMDNERSIPSLVDGFKPGQRKVIFTCFKRNLVKELKVAQLAGSVAEQSAYHHGEASLMSTIINLAQNFVGSNNINLLQPIGQFGTRLHGGKDAASPRYIFTCLSPLARHLFNVHDEPLLNFQNEDNQRIEPVWYVPILPMVLVNGAEGIGTGWSTKIPNYNPQDIVRNLLFMIDGNEPQQLVPWFKNFRGTIEQLSDGRLVVNGEIAVLDEGTVEITELPVGVWTQSYKENVLEPMLQGTEKTPAVISDYKEYHTDCTVRFVVKMSAQKLASTEQEGLHKFFKLQQTMSTNSMVLFDANGVIKRYTSPMDMLKEFFTLRLDLYERRKNYLEGMLLAESLKLDNQARFILEKVEGKISIENKPTKQIIDMLFKGGYASDPVKEWKASQERNIVVSEEEEDNEASQPEEGRDYDYILNLPMKSLSKEKVDEIVKQRDKKAEELYQIQKKTPADLWKADLKAFQEELVKVEAQEAADNAGAAPAGAKGKKPALKLQVKPSPAGRRVTPKIVVAEVKKEKKNKKSIDKANDEDGETQDGVGDTDTKEKPKKLPQKRQPKAPKKEGMNSPDKKDKAKKRKSNPWSDESDSDGSALSIDDVSPVVGARDKPARTAAKKVKYNFESESDDSDFVSGPPKTEKKIQKDDDHIVLSDSEDGEASQDAVAPVPPEVAPVPKQKAQKPPAKRQLKAPPSKDDEASQDAVAPVAQQKEKKPPAKRQLKAPPKKDAKFGASPAKKEKKTEKPKKKNPWSDESDVEISDVSMDNGNSSLVAAQRDKPSRAAAKKIKYNFSSDESD